MDLRIDIPLEGKNCTREINSYADLTMTELQQELLARGIPPVGDDKLELLEMLEPGFGARVDLER